MRDEVSSYTIRGRDKPVLLSLARDNPVGFLYIEGLLESRGGMMEFLCSLISGWDGLENWFAPPLDLSMSEAAGFLSRLLREPLYYEP